MGTATSINVAGVEGRRTEPTAVARAEERGVTWTVHPARERTGAAVAVILLTVAFGGAVAAAFGDGTWFGLAWGYGAAAAAALVVSLVRFWVPTTYTIGRERLEMRTIFARTTSHRWRDIRRFVHDEKGGVLSRRAVSSRWEAAKGGEFTILLPSDPGLRGRVCGQIKQKIAQAHEDEGGKV